MAVPAERWPLRWWNSPGGLGVETVVSGLEIPWDLAFTPDGRILITERTGRIRVVQDGALQETPYATIDVFHRSEAGLMGIALHPDFTSNGYLYVCYTYREGRAIYNRIARLTDRGDRADGHHVVLDHIPGATRHDGCRIRFGPDGYLYATTGDATDPGLSQDLDSLAGKVLRLADDGSVPPDNPFSGSPVYTWGHRNPQGLDWHPVTGDLFITEHGPDRDDEVNILAPGQNYGWPEVTGAAGDSRYVGRHPFPDAHCGHSRGGFRRRRQAARGLAGQPGFRRPEELPPAKDGAGTARIPCRRPQAKPCSRDSLAACGRW